MKEKEKLIFILNAVCYFSGESEEDVKSKNQSGKLPDCRKIYSSLAYKYTSLTYEEIGRFINYKRTGVISQVEASKDLFKYDKEYKNTYVKVRQKLNNVKVKRVSKAKRRPKKKLNEFFNILNNSVKGNVIKTKELYGNAYNYVLKYNSQNDRQFKVQMVEGVTLIKEK